MCREKCLWGWMLCAERASEGSCQGGESEVKRCACEREGGGSCRGQSERGAGGAHRRADMGRLERVGESQIFPVTVRACFATKRGREGGGGGRMHAGVSTSPVSNSAALFHGSTPVARRRGSGRGYTPLRGGMVYVTGGRVCTLGVE